MMKKTTRNYIWTLTANFLLLAAVAGIWQYRIKADSFDTSVYAAQGIVIHEDVKQVQAAYLKDLQTASDIADLKGQWTLVNLWASWCPPCIVEMPSLEKLGTDYKGKGLQVIAISMDAKKEQASAAARKHGFGPFAQNWDETGAVMMAFSPPNLPMSYLIDPAGNLRATFTGQYDWATPQIRALFDRFLKVSSSVPAPR